VLTLFVVHTRHLKEVYIKFSKLDKSDEEHCEARTDNNVETTLKRQLKERDR